MTNEELKKKIVEIIINAIWKDAEADYDSTDETEAGSIADALILEGIGYVWDITEKAEKAIASLIKQNKELQHRAARAERALDKAVELAYEFRTEADTLSCSSCPMFHIFDSCKDRGLYQDCSKQWKEELIKQAEKELAEENDGKKEV